MSKFSFVLPAIVSGWIQDFNMAGNNQYISANLITYKYPPQVSAGNPFPFGFDNDIICFDSGPVGGISFIHFGHKGPFLIFQSVISRQIRAEVLDADA